MRHIAIIPARAGSKSIPNKNLQKLHGKSLVKIALQSALDSQLFQKIIISTDIPILFEEIEETPWVCLHRRPEVLCGDDALQQDVVMDVLETFKISDRTYFWLLQPTSPYRIKKDFEMIEEMLGEGAMSIISVKDVGAHHPDRTYTIKRNELWPLAHTDFRNKQELPRVYIRNGAFYVGRAKEFRAARSFYIKPCRPHLMPDRRSVNIDSWDDLKFAQWLAEQ